MGSMWTEGGNRHFPNCPILVFQHTGVALCLLIGLKTNSQLPIPMNLLDDVTVGETPKACE